jgi:hypothetical protein
MELDVFCEKAATMLKGEITSAKWKSVVPTPKKDGHTVIKVTEGIVRQGVDYAHIASVKAAGLGTNPLPGDEKWKYFPYVIEGKNGLKVRLTKVNNPKRLPKSYYEVDGKRMTKEEVAATGYVAPSYLAPKKGDSPIFNVKLENLISFGK